MRKITAFLVLGLGLVAGLAGLPATAGAQTTANTKSELYVAPIQVQEVGGREAYDAVQNGAVQLNTGVRVDSHAEVVSESADRQTPKTDFGDRLRFNFIWDSQTEPPDLREGLKAEAQKNVAGDSNIQEITVSQEAVTIEYRRPAKLFGFIPVAYYHAFTLDGKGNLSHGRPWWLIFTTDDAADFELGVEAAFQHNQSTNAEFLEFLKLEDHRRLFKTLDILSNLLKTQHEVSMSVIRNMK